jgi:hypothetical protein
MIRALVVLCALSSGCAHQVMVKSEPPGASVYVDDQKVGVTPVAIEEKTGPSGLMTIEVQHGDRAQRLAYKRAGFAVQPIVVGAVAGAVVFVGGITLLFGSVLILPIAFIATVATFGLGAPFLLLALAAYVGGIVGVSIGPDLPLWAAGFYGRQGPDSILVDFTSPQDANAARVSSSPADMVVPFLGHTRHPLAAEKPAATNAGP